MIIILIILSFVLFTPNYGYAQQYLIKFATVAPEGSTWMKVMKEYDKAVRTESGGRVGFKIYPGGIHGDEKDVLRKIKLGQLHSTGVTGNGITNIAPIARILDSPFLFRSYDEVDHIYATFDTEFSKSFEDGGYVLLGWAEVGFVYIFTNTEVSTPEQLKGVKMWLWEGDPVAEAAFKILNISPIPLSITDVLTSLQTKLIDGIYTSPYAAIVLQWFTRVKYMINVPLADAAGAVIISKQKFDEMPKDIQEILVRNGRTYMKKLTQLSREENQRAIETLKKHGIKIVESNNPNALQEYEKLGSQARRSLVGKLYSEDFLNRVEQAIFEFRKNREIH